LFDIPDAMVLRHKLNLSLLSYISPKSIRKSILFHVNEVLDVLLLEVVVDKTKLAFKLVDI
jgi:hypothetical protein